MIGVLDRFGESGAPWELVKEFEVSAEHIAAKAKELCDFAARSSAAGHGAAKAPKAAKTAKAKPAAPRKAVRKPAGRKAAKKVAKKPARRGRIPGRAVKKAKRPRR
jgi:hypothetical protein